MNRRDLLLVGKFLASLAVVATGCAIAADYPNKPISIVVPFATGGPTDSSARLVANALSKRMGNPFVVENVPGAASTIGTTKVAKAAPDGYTLLWATVSSLAIAPYLYENIRYDPIKSFTPVGQAVSAPFVLVAKPALGVKTVADLVSLAKKEPGKLNYASTGTGGSAHMIGELFKKQGNLSAVHVPYNGGSPMMTALLGGEVDFLFDTPTTITPMIKSNRVVPLAVTSLQRWPDLPDLKTMDEQGFKGFNATTWFGMLAPAETPPDIVTLLGKQLSEVLKEPEVAAALNKMGFQVQYLNTEQFAKRIADDGQQWSSVIKAANISLKQ